MRACFLLLGPVLAFAACAAGRTPHSAFARSPCRAPSADPLLQRAQHSEAFATALDDLNEAEAGVGASLAPEHFDRICAEMTVEAPALLPNVSLVHTPAVYGIERSFMMFAVADDNVLLLNPRPDGTFAFGLTPSHWDTFLESASLTPQLTHATAARSYACLLLKYLENYLPGDVCMEDEDAQVVHRAPTTWHVTLPRFKWSVEFTEQGRIIVDS